MPVGLLVGSGVTHVAKRGNGNQSDEIITEGGDHWHLPRAHNTKHSATRRGITNTLRSRHSISYTTLNITFVSIYPATYLLPRRVGPAELGELNGVEDHHPCTSVKGPDLLIPQFFAMGREPPAYSFGFLSLLALPQARIFHVALNQRNKQPESTRARQEWGPRFFHLQSG